MLVREGGGFCLRRDAGGIYKLQLHRMPVDHIEKRVRVTGTMAEDDIVDVEGIAPA